MPLSETLQQITGKRVLVVGDVIADEYLVGESSHISSEAHVPVLRYTGERATLGGAGNTAANVTSLGGAATLVGLVGDDAAGTDIAARCAAARIEFVPLRDGRPTTRKVRVISQQQQLLRIDYEETASIDAGGLPHRRAMRYTPARATNSATWLSANTRISSLPSSRRPRITPGNPGKNAHRGNSTSTGP